MIRNNCLLTSDISHFFAVTNNNHLVCWFDYRYKYELFKKIRTVQII